MVMDMTMAGRLFDVIDVVATEGVCSLQKISDRTGISFSAVHRIAQTLIERGYVVTAQRGAYCLGPAAVCLGQAVSQRDLLRNAARPIIIALGRACRAHAHLGILEEDMVTYLIKSTYGRRGIFSVEGTQLEAYCTALGKSLLAYQPTVEIERYLDRGDFIALTPATLTCPAALREELSLVRSSGWAFDNEEAMTGLRCIARPVRDVSGTVVAAMSVSLKTKHIDDWIVDTLKRNLNAAVMQIEHKLSGRKSLPPQFGLGHRDANNHEGI